MPTEEEFETLFTAVGGQSTAGKVLESTSGWNNSGNGGTDTFGFSALPAGLGYGESFSKEGDYASFWSSTEGDSDFAYYMCLSYFGEASLDIYYKHPGLSVRCLQD